MLNIPEIREKLLPINPDSLEDIGDILQYALPWATLFFIALTGSIRGAQNWAYAGLANSLLTFLLKSAFNFTPWGERPNGGMNSFPQRSYFQCIYGSPALLISIFGELWVIVLYILAGLTGYSRVVSENHWWRDVAAGAALGVLVSYLTLAWLG